MLGDSLFYLVPLALVSSSIMVTEGEGVGRTCPLVVCGATVVDPLEELVLRFAPGNS